MKRNRFFSILILVMLCIVCLFTAVGCKKKSVENTSSDVRIYFHGNKGSDSNYWLWVGTSYRSEVEWAYRDCVQIPEGEKFLGWYNADGVQYLDQNNTLVDGLSLTNDLHLYAKIVPLQFTLVLHVGDGTLEETAETTLKYVYTDSLSILPTPTSNEISKEFDGWYNESGELCYVKDTTPAFSTFKDANLYAKSNAQDFHVYAQYKTKRVKITLDYDDRLKPTSVTVDYGTPFKELDLSAYEKEDVSKEVTGWEMFDGGEFPETITKEIKLKAVWTSFRDLQFEYSADDVRTQRVYLNGENKYGLVPPSDRPGYRFMGWYGNANYTGLKYDYAPLSVNYFYAKWEPAVYEVNFVCDNGETFETVNYCYGDAMELPTPTAATGYTFAGWTESQESDAQAVFKITANMYGDKSLYATWKPETYSLTLNTGYGFLKTEEATVEFDRTYTLPVPKRMGYTFQGWYSAVEGGVRYTNGEGFSLKAWEQPQGIELFARYAVSSYTIRYQTDGGSAVAQQLYDHGEYFQFPSAPEKSGYTFGGWYNEDFTQEYTERVTVRENVTLYAKWIENSVAVSDANGLRAIAENPSGTYHLTDDINLMGGAWSPIPEFTGTLDGKGFKIFNFSLTSTSTETFGFIRRNKGTVKNTVFSKVTVNSTTDVAGGAGVSNFGVIAGLNEGTIRNCTVTECSVQATAKSTPVAKNTSRNELYIGGLVGNNSGIIEACFADGIQATATLGLHHTDEVNKRYEIHGNLYLGGIAGIAQNASVIRGCTVTGSLTANTSLTGVIYESKSSCANYLGGIVGYNLGQCWNNAVNATISGVAAEGWSKHYYWHGETPFTILFLGGITSTNCNLVSHCIFEGKAIAEASRYIRMGGIGGQNNAQATLADCYAKGTFTQKGGAEKMTGGIVGNNYATVKNCYFNGSLNCSEERNGAIVGNNEPAGMILNSFSLVPVKFKGINYGSISGCATVGSEYAASPSVATYTETELLSAQTIFNVLYFDIEVWALTEDGLKLYWQA